MCFSLFQTGCISGNSMGIAVIIAMLSHILNHPVDPRWGFTGAFDESAICVEVDGIDLKLEAAILVELLKLIMPGYNYGQDVYPNYDESVLEAIDIPKVRLVCMAVELVFGKAY